MPLILNKDNFNSNLLVWKITESIDFFLENVVLNAESKLRLQNMKSESHQKGFLAVRMLLQSINLTDFDLFYTEDGKPNLNNHKNISISHSFEYSCIMISSQKIGIDIEKHKEKIKKIDYKFAKNEMQFLDTKSEDYIEYLTIIWGVKEAIFKIMNEPGISFNDHILVKNFELKNKKGMVNLNFNQSEQDFEFEFRKLGNYNLVTIIS